MLRKSILGAAGLVVALAICSSAHAALLGVTLLPAPDITSGLVQVNYNAASHAYTATGFALSLELPPPEPPPDWAISGGNFNISLMVDNAGVLQSGSLNITGSVAGIGATTPLLQGAATGFGYQDSPGGPLFDFTFLVTGGSLATQGHFPVGATVGVILNAGTSFSGSFQTNYANSGTGSADTALVPEPASVALLLLGGVFARRKLRA